MDIRIRKIDVHELPLIVRLANEIWPATYRGILAADQIRYMMELFYTPDALMAQVTEKAHQFIVVEKNERPLGFASYSSTDLPGVYKLHKIYVHQEMQG